MSTLAELVPTTVDHMIHLVDNIRDEDRAEIYAASGLTVGDAVSKAIASSYWLRTMLVDGEPVAIGGVSLTQLRPEAGVPWMLGTRAIDENPFHFLRAARKAMKEMVEIAPILYNVVYVKSTKSIRFLRMLGFTIGETEHPIGVNGEKFYEFWRINNV